MTILGEQNKEKEWLDYSGCATMLRCPRNFLWNRIKKIEKKSGKSALINGKAYHQAIATYHEARIAGHSYEDSCAMGLGELPEIMAEITEEHKKRNLLVAISCVSGYFERWRNEPYRVKEVEIGFSVPINNDFNFVGKIDTVKENPMGLFINETKTTTVVGDRWFLRGKPNLQIESYISAYALLTGKMPAGGILDVIPIHENPAKRKEPFRVITMREKKDVLLWKKQVLEYWNMIQRWRDMDFFPMNTENCVPLMGWTCEYVQLCEQYPEIKMDEKIPLTSDYQFNDWNPLNELSGG